MKKKIVGVLLLFVLLFNVVGCGNTKNTDSNDNNNVNEETKETEKKELSNREYELEDSSNRDSVGNLTKYDSGVFYYDNATIRFQVPKGYESTKKNIYSVFVTENFVKKK